MITGAGIRGRVAACVAAVRAEAGDDGAVAVVADAEELGGSLAAALHAAAAGDVGAGAAGRRALLALGVQAEAELERTLRLWLRSKHII